MKKIFAIALALVMVLSMASAFALNNCSGAFAWGCPADYDNCGKGKVEVIPYVKVNTACDGVDWQVSTCATAINTENVFYAVKLTVEAHADDAWWEMTNGYADDNWGQVEMSYDGVTAGAAVLAIPASVWADEDEAVAYYYNFNTNAWVEDDKDFEMGGAYIKQTAVTEADEAEVCAALVSEHDGFGDWEYGDYDVKVTTTGITVTDGTNTVWMNYELGKKITAVSTTKDAFFAQVVSDFNLGSCAVGTCVTEDNIQDNFGWDDEFESCFAWSDKGAAVVDAECVVAIPKTGDASVLAWLF